MKDKCYQFFFLAGEKMHFITALLLLARFNTTILFIMSDNINLKLCVNLFY